jgi:YggT family protein
MGALFLANFLRFVLIGLEVLIFARVLLSWVDPGGRGAIAGFVVQTTEPILAPVRRFLPRSGMLDLSPLVVLLVLGAVIRAVG